MSIATRTAYDVTILDLKGKIILGEACTELRSTIRELLRAGHKDILLNLAEVTYMDSAGIGELVSAFSSVSSQGGRLKLLNLTKKMHELLAITKLLTVFDCFDEENRAVQSFRSAKA